MTFRAARCPSCSGELQVPDDRDVVKCMYCGGNVIVREAIQAAAGGNIQSWFILAETAASASNNQEAYNYYNRILEVDPNNPRAWMGKAEAAGWMSTLVSFRLPEMLTGFQRAIDCASDDDKEQYRTEVAFKITNTIGAYYKLAREHLLEFISLDNVWQEYLQQCELMMTGLETAHSYAPTEETIVDYLIYIFRDNIHGVAYWDQYARNGPVQLVKVLAPQYEAHLKSKLDFYIAKKQKLNPSYVAEPITKAKVSSCFVATATMGGADHPVVLTLKEFRDQCLVGNSLGRGVVAVYNRYGPYLAYIVSKKQSRKAVSYFFVVAPAAWIARRLLRRSA